MINPECFDRETLVRLVEQLSQQVEALLSELAAERAKAHVDRPFFMRRTR